MRDFLLWIISLFFAPPPAKAPDVQREEAAAPPRPDIQVVGPVIRTPENDTILSDARWYMSTAMRALLKLIGEHEGGRAGYNADFRNDDRWILSNYTFDEVRALSRRQVTVDKEPSSAIGLYQFLTKTLDSLKVSLRLTGKERFTNSFQDDLAVALMIRRGLLDYLRGKISLNTFCNNLAMEWASLPVVSPVKRGNRTMQPGRSYYAGDGLNKSFHKVQTILDAVTAMRASLVKVMPKELQ